MCGSGTWITTTRPSYHCAITAVTSQPTRIAWFVGEGSSTEQATCPPPGTTTSSTSGGPQRLGRGPLREECAVKSAESRGRTRLTPKGLEPTGDRESCAAARKGGGEALTGAPPILSQLLRSLGLGLCQLLRRLGLPGGIRHPHHRARVTAPEPTSCRTRLTRTTRVSSCQNTHCWPSENPPPPCPIGCSSTLDSAGRCPRSRGMAR